MIVTLLSLALSQPGADVTEVRRPGSGWISVQFFAPVTLTTDEDRLLARFVEDRMGNGSASHPASTIRDLTEGEGVTVRWLPTGLRVGAVVPREFLADGIALVQSSVWASRWQPGPRESWPLRDRLTFATPSWQPTEEELAHWRQRHLPRDAGWVIIEGDFQPGEAAQQWSEGRQRLGIRSAPRPRPRAYPSLLPASDGTVTWRGPVTRDAFPTLAAVFALGIGKGSSVFRVVRQDLGLVYDWEAVLWPTADGAQGILSLGSGQTLDRADLTSRLLADIEQWDQSSLDRAAGMARASWRHGVNWDPLRFGPSNRSARGEESFRTEFWRRHLGGDWDLDRIAEQISRLPVETVQTAARAIVQNQGG